MCEMVVFALSLRERFLQRRVDLAPVVLALHVDEVEDDDAADVPEPELVGDLAHGLEVRLQDRVLQGPLAHVPAGVDVDGGERLGLVDDDVPARLEPDLPAQGARDLDLDAVVLEDGLVAVVGLHAPAEAGDVGVHEFLDALVFIGGVDDHPVHVPGEHVADHAEDQVQLVVQQRRRRGAFLLLLDGLPQAAPGTRCPR